MTPERARSWMTHRVAELTTRQTRIETHLRGGDGRREGDAEPATLLQSDDVLEGLDEAARDELAGLRAALLRVDAGTWGTCVGCGEPIPAGRLDALPAAATCSGCAARASACG
jgi:RNA polymerase-binding transcription factor DksA